MTRMRSSLSSVVAVLLIGAPCALQSQEPLPADCTYDACAIRLDHGVFSGLRIVRGIEAERVARIGFFAPDFSVLVARSDSAAHYAQIFESRHNGGALLAGVGAVVGAIGLFMLFDDFEVFGGEESSDDTGAYVGFAGAIISGIGGMVQLSAQKPLHQAIWWYNRELAVPDPQR